MKRKGNSLKGRLPCWDAMTLRDTTSKYPDARYWMLGTLDARWPKHDEWEPAARHGACKAAGEIDRFFLDG